MMNTDSRGGVLVFSEKDDMVHEILAKGRSVADQMKSPLTAISLGSNAVSRTQEKILYGADKVLVLDDSTLDMADVETYMDLLFQITLVYKLDLILIGATKKGYQLAASLAQRLDIPCISGCLDFWLEGPSLVAQRMRFGGKFVSKLLVRKKPWLLTVLPGAFVTKRASDERRGEVERLQIQPKVSRTRIVEVREKESGFEKMESAKAVVCVGRGLRRREDLKIAEELARTIGAVVVGSRPITDDLKWLPREVQIGLSGKMIRPDLYIGCGVSGQIQHVVGIRDAKVVVAINTDPNAPIGEESDYFVIADLYEFLPILNETLREVMKKKPTGTQQPAPRPP